MTAISTTSTAQFQQLRNRLNDSTRKASAALIKAVKAGNASDRTLLSKALLDLDKQDEQLRELYRQYQASNLTQSDAEKALLIETARANKLTKSLNTTTKIVSVVGDMASILARLLALF